MTDEKIEACPGCDSSSLTRRRREPDLPRYKCKDCGREFDDPRMREKRYSGHLVGLARELDNTNPEEVQ